MSNPFPFSPEVLPNYYLLLCQINCLHLLAWLVAVVIGFRRQWSWGLILLIPLFYPFALLVLALKRIRWIGWIAAVHGLLLCLWFAGGVYLKSSEWHQLLAAEEALKAKGELLDPTLLHDAPEAVPEKNVWDHPLLITLAQAGQSDATHLDDLLQSSASKSDAGDLARERMEEEYGWLSMPDITNISLIFEHQEGRSKTLYTPLQTLYREAWVQKHADDPKQDSPELSNDGFGDLESLLEAMEVTHETHQPRFEGLMEALRREQDVYPFAFENGPAILLPHLSCLKDLAKRARQRLVWQAYRRDADASFQTMQDMFVIHGTEWSNILICRLVEVACWRGGLQGVVALQNQHLWSDERWQWLEQALAEIQLEASIPGVMDMERATFIPWLKLQADENTMRVITMLDLLGGGSRPTRIGQLILMGPLGRCVNTHMQAFYIKQLRLLHAHYDHLGKKAENILDQFQHQPWSGMESQLPTYDRGSIGVLSAMLTPPLDIYDRFYSAQLMVEMAKASISLERHYLKHGQYPVRLKDLVPEFRDTVPLDPMSGQPFHYRKLGNDGFEFYSVGWNGKDDSGFPGDLSRDHGLFDDEGMPDDVLWRVEGSEESLPVVLTELEKEEDVLKKY
ncbi:hypothetical protein OAL86_01875 [Verrucomicrobia bacterium]|nr:hypothetical protein [Verrucomicrobiota bacterium]